MRRRPEELLVRGAATAAVLLLTAACAAERPRHTTAGAPTPASSATESTGPVCSAFSLQLAAGVTGQPSPLEAARWFAGHGGVVDVPPAGWHEAGRDETGSLVRSGRMTLHVIRGEDLTWLVDSGRTC